MPNTIKTNTLAELVAVRFAEAAAFLTVGSSKYFAGQLVGKRNGQTYKFVVRDTGEAVNALAISGGDKVTIVEREISLTLDPFHVAVETNAIESVTDLNWDKEIAQPNSQKLVNAVTKKAVRNALGHAMTAFVGEGFLPLSRASAHLASVTSEKLYGFIDPNIEAVLTSNGQQFVPVGAPDMYKMGLLGTFHGAEYRAQRFFEQVNITAGCVTGLTGATTKSSGAYTDNSNGTATLKLTFSAAAAGFKIPRGTPVWLDGVYACDCVGDVTGNKACFVVLEDVSVATSATSADLKVRAVDMTAKSGTREIAGIDGADLAATDLVSLDITIPAAGVYFGGLIRANGAYEFETLDKLDAEGADYEKGSVDGVTIHKNKLVELGPMTNKTRFDIVDLAGVVEPRACAYVLIK